MMRSAGTQGDISPECHLREHHLLGKAWETASVCICSACSVLPLWKPGNLIQAPAEVGLGKTDGQGVWWARAQECLPDLCR